MRIKFKRNRPLYAHHRACAYLFRVVSYGTVGVGVAGDFDI